MFDFILELDKHGANALVQNKVGTTPLDIILDKNYKEVIEYYRIHPVYGFYIEGKLKGYNKE